MNMGRPKKEDKNLDNKTEEVKNTPQLDLGIDIEKLIEEKAKELFDKKMKELQDNQTDINNEIEETKEEKPKRLFKNRKNNSIDIVDKKRKIPLVCVVDHRVGYKCKLNNLFIIWDGKGDEHEISIEEAQLMYAEDENFLKNWLIADDEEFAEAMNLTSIYEIIFEIENIEQFYSQRMITIEKKLDDMPEGIRSEFLNTTAVKIMNGELNTANVLAVVKLLKSKYNMTEIEL
jgi:hypothetical protein